MAQAIDIDFDIGHRKRRIAPVVEHTCNLRFAYLAYAPAAGAYAVEVLSGAYAALILHRSPAQMMAPHYSAVNHQLHVGVDCRPRYAEVAPGEAFGQLLDGEVSVEVKNRVENRAPLGGVAQLPCGDILRKRFGGFSS